MFDNVVRVYNKNMQLLAIFDGNMEGLSEDAMRNVMVSPTVRIESNGLSTLTFQMLPTSEKWLQIRDPENIYVLNDRYYTALEENAYQYTNENDVQIVNVTLSERWILLNRQYNQAYNCAIYTYAKARFSGYTNDGATFTINAAECSNPGNTISSANAWEQVKAWTPKDDDGNKLTYSILSSKEYKATGWEKVPSGVFIRSITISGNTATVTIESRSKRTAVQTFPYGGSSYKLNISPTPSSLENVSINYTAVSEDGTHLTSEKNIPFTYSSASGTVTLNYTPEQGENINGVLITYGYSDLGKISPGATCTFAYGAESIDEHTFAILPKAKSKYKLVVDGVSYDDSQVKDSRGVIMPRGSGGYAMWAALKNSGWTLGICDVIATGFDASIDYGCFNVESDMQDVLYNIQYIQELYGGILDWDSHHKILNYRAENNTDYQAYNDDFNLWRGYEFREGKNMTDRPVITVDNRIITKAYLLGYGNLNVKKVNGGKSYIENHEFSNDTYEGYLRQDLIYDTNDEGGQRQLLYWGKKVLAKQCRPRKTIELSVTDIRTVEGHEHEVFDINNIVRVWYTDDETGEYKYEEQRVVTWEYNAFSMWDCTVELGDKTRNMIEVFRLVYKKTANSPGTNGSGNISSSNITMAGEWDGNGYYGDESSLTNYIELIARTTTDNSDAISGLTLDTNDLYAQADLFAYYQKQTDTLFTETYAAFHAYADEVGSEVSAIAEGYYEKLDDKIGNLNITSMAGYEAVQNQFEAYARQFAEYKIEVDNDIRQAKSDVLTYANETYAQASVLSQYATLDYIRESGFITESGAEGTFSRMFAIEQMSGNIASESFVEAAIGRITLNSMSNGSINISSGNIDIDAAGTIYLRGMSVQIPGVLQLTDKSIYIGGYQFSTGRRDYLSDTAVVLYAIGT